jgi:hypothetical protein
MTYITIGASIKHVTNINWNKKLILKHFNAFLKILNVEAPVTIYIQYIQI